jgi:HEAT repeat protein
MVRSVLVLGWLAGAYVALVLVVAVFGAIREARAVRRAGRHIQAGPPSWSMSLLVQVDEDHFRVCPAVQLHGSPLPSGAEVRIEVVDARGLARTVSRRPLPASAIGCHVPLPAFSPPDGMSVERALRATWHVVIEDRTGERVRWTERLTAMGQLNDEAELAAGPGADRDSPGDPEVSLGLSAEDGHLLRRIVMESGYLPSVVARLHRGAKLDEWRALRWLADQVGAGHADDLDLHGFAAQVLGHDAEPSSLGQLRDVLGGSDDEPTRLAAGRVLYSRSTLDRSLLAAGRPALGGALARGLRSGNLRVHAACLWALFKLGDENIHEVIGGLLPASDHGARFEIVRVLGFVGDRRATPVLVESLARESSAKLRSAILWALGTLADPAALRPCIDALEDGDPQTRGYAAWVLGKIGDPSAVIALWGALSDPDPDVRGWVEGALRQLGSSVPVR